MKEKVVFRSRRPFLRLGPGWRRPRFRIEKPSRPYCEGDAKVPSALNVMGRLAGSGRGRCGVGIGPRQRCVRGGGRR
eukprot:8565281-Alexandrium_andersonii.AAC.1